MSRNFHESFSDQTPVEMPKPRATGIVFAVVALIVAVLFRDTLSVLLIALGLSAAFALTAWLVPARLDWLNRAWFRFGLMLHKIMSPLIMFVLFAVVVTPYGLAMQLFRDPLRKRAGRRVESYWVDRRDDDPIDMKAQF